MSGHSNAFSTGLTRRGLLAAASAGAYLAIVGPAGAQDAAQADPREQALAALMKDFSFDALSKMMQDVASRDYVAPKEITEFPADLNYDGYRLIRFDPEHARFSDIEEARIRLHAFHMGWLFKVPIGIYEVADGRAAPMEFGPQDFLYQREAGEMLPENWTFPGVSGFRLHAPLNRPDIFDELVAFQGASYFRALGRNSTYGLSARGLAINTGSSQPEEFPRFSSFFVERPAPGQAMVTVYATLESPSLAGAYRFVITPGDATVMDVTARLFMRADVKELGIAPLTSMFLYGDRNREDFDDYRPRVHDSEGLSIEFDGPAPIWRALSNPPRLASSYFGQVAPKSFGLYQRNRDFDDYQDAAAHYERRPSLRVEPIGDWGRGTVRLLEIPSKSEIHDNIAAFFMPEGGAKAGEAREYAYRLFWGDLAPAAVGELAHVVASRAGIGGYSGDENPSDHRKFVVDFRGGMLSSLPGDAIKDLEAAVSVSNGEIVSKDLSRIPWKDTWRLVVDVTAQSGATVELTAHVEGYGRRLSETWAYQWIKQ